MLCLGTAAVGTGTIQAESSGSESAGTNVMDLSFDELLAVNVDKVYGASKYEQDTTRAPSSVSIVTRDEFQKQGYRTLADALRSVNGLFMTDDRNYSYLGMRGFNRPGDYNSRVLLLVDGHRMNDLVYDQGLYGTEGFLDTDDLERVEVIRGPSSSIYGNNAFFGVVNVLTRPGHTINGLEATAQAGDEETFKGALRYGKQWQSGLEVFLSGTFYESSGEEHIFFPEFNSPTNHNGVAVNSDGDRAYNFFGSVGYEAFTLTGGWSWRQKNVPTASFGTAFNDGGEQTTDARAYVDLKYDQEFAHDLRFIGHVAYDS
jgi:outer membrane receptor for ferrienterochelin and colicins